MSPQTACLHFILTHMWECNMKEYMPSILSLNVHPLLISLIPKFSHLLPSWVLRKSPLITCFTPLHAMILQCRSWNEPIIVLYVILQFWHSMSNLGHLFRKSIFMDINHPSHRIFIVDPLVYWFSLCLMVVPIKWEQTSYAHFVDYKNRVHNRYSYLWGTTLTLNKFLDIRLNESNLLMQCGSKSVICSTNNLTFQVRIKLIDI